MNEKTEAIKVYREIKKFLKDYLKVSYKLKIALGGSVAKCTSLNYKEMDVYIYAKRGNKNLIEQILDLDKIFSFTQKRYSTDPYITLLNYKNFTVDIVPVIKESASMQYSLLHVAYIKKHLKCVNEVIKLKKWLIDNRLYHSNTPYGISGYMSELIIIEFNTFESMFTKPKEVYIYVKNIKDPVNNKRLLYKGVSLNVKRKLYLKLKYKLGVFPFKKLMERGLKIVKTPFSYDKLPRLKTIKTYCRKFSVFFEYIYSLEHIYVLYFSTTHVIKYSRHLKKGLKLKNILMSNYLSPILINEFVKLYSLDFTQLTEEGEKIDIFNIDMYETDLDYLKHDFITLQFTGIIQLPT
jgi:hypothetical protein